MHTLISPAAQLQPPTRHMQPLRRSLPAPAIVTLLFIVISTVRAIATCAPPCTLGSCSSASCPYAQRPYPPTPTSAHTPQYPVRPKDFAFIQRDSSGHRSYHLFYIIARPVGEHSDTSENRLGHAWTTRLDSTWSTLPSVLPIRPDNWDNFHIWAPCIVARSDTFYMFYTGVDTGTVDGGRHWTRQRIGLAWSTNLTDWQRFDAAVLGCSQVPWAWCDSLDAQHGQDFRDPFVMPDPNEPQHWLMYYTATARDTTMVPGLAYSTGDFTCWRDSCRLWTKDSRWWTHQRILESPHLFQHNSTWYLFFTTDAGQPLEYVTSSCPADTGTFWGNWGRLANLDCFNSEAMYASEYHADTAVAVQEYFCNCTGNSIDIRRIHWGPGERFSFDFIRPAAVSDLTAEMGKTTAAITWTAPGDDSLSGTACRSRVAYSTGTITESNFFDCDTLPTAPPDTAGAVECAATPYGRLSPCTWYYFALKTRDDALNWSALSTVISGKTRCSGSIEVTCDEGFMAQGQGPEGWTLENSVLNLAGVGRPATDVYLLKTPIDRGADRAAMRLSQKGPGVMTLDETRLAVVDHTADAEVFVSDGQVLLGTASAVFAVADATGADTSPVLDASEYARVGTAGDAWGVTLAEKSRGRQALLVEIAGCRTADSGEESGVEVQIPASGGAWVTVSRLHPRRGFDTFVVDSLEANQVRLLFQQEYLDRRLARVEPRQVVILSPVEPDTAVHSRLGIVTDAVAASGGTSTEVRNGEAVVLEYLLPALAKDMERDLILLLRGERSADGAPHATARRAPKEDAWPTAFALRQNQPNPFKTSATIRFDLPIASSVALEVYDAQGRKVRTLARGLYLAGCHAVEWNERDEGGNFVRPGVYLYRIVAGSFRDQKKMVLLP